MKFEFTSLLMYLSVELYCEIFIFVKTYVGSESEIDVFESVDKQRQAIEMVWLNMPALVA
jgi:hypothetical protein